MTNKEKADYFKKQAGISLKEYMFNLSVTPRTENVVFAEKLFKIHSVLTHITNMIKTGNNRDEGSLASLLGSVDRYAADQVDLQWVQGNLITLNKGK